MEDRARGRGGTQDELVEFDDRYRVAFDLAPLGIALIGTDGSIREINDAWAEIVGYPPEALIGRDARELLPTADDRRRMEELAEVQASSGGKIIMETVLDRADGSTVWVRAESSVVRGDDDHMLYVINLLADISERKRLEGMLEHQATHDPLTGLPNRLVLGHLLENALARRDVRPGSVAVLFVDLDDFKPVNDRYGHAAGDELLIHVAERLRHSVRDGDTVARHGGDEFVVLCEAIDGATEAVEIAERVCVAMRDAFVLPMASVTIGASVGVALNDASSASDLLRHADAAMYRAKLAGRGRAVLYA